MNPDVLAKLVAAASTAMVALVQRWQQGEIDDTAFVAAAVALLVAEQSRGVALADYALAVALTASRGVPVPSLGLAPDEDASSRSVAAVRDILAAKDDPEALSVRVEVEVRDTIQQAAQKASGRALRGHNVKGWTRVLDAGACKVCAGLAASVDPEGIPVSVDMYRHTGCGCTQAPVE